MIKVREVISRTVATLTAAIMVFSQSSLAVQAREGIDTSRSGSLSVTYNFGEDKMFDGVNSRIYKIASATEGGSFELDAGYIDRSSIKDLSGITDEAKAQQEWKQILDDVLQYAVSEHQPDQTAVSANGQVKFSGLELGIYLVSADNYQETENTYVFAPFLVSVPQLDDSDKWVYDAQAGTKCEKFDRMVDLELHKRWSDEGYSDRRPSSIDVKIIKNNELYQTVNLNDSNNWTYVWTEKPGNTWSFEEVLPSDSGYSASISESKTYNGDVASEIYTITNTYTPPAGPPPGGDEHHEEDNGGHGDGGATEFPDVLGAVRKLSELPAVLGARRLPQTGQLWWPLPILIIVGVALIVKGIRRNRNI